MNMNLERRIAAELVKELKEEIKEELIVKLSDQEIKTRVEDAVNDYVEFFEEEQYDDILQEVDRIFIRSLNRDKELSFERDADDYGYTITGVKNDEYLISVPGDYRQYYNEETNLIDKKCPLKFKNGNIVEIKKDYVFIKKNPNFRLKFGEVTFT
jgi:hypothetical protein